MFVKTLLLVTCALMATTALARSQALPTASKVASPEVAAAPIVQPPAKIDLGALYYFAAQNDFGRVAAEMRRIRVKHPGWQPPEDLYSEHSRGVDEQPLWDLFAKHDLAGLHAKIAAMQKEKANWQPSGDLAGKLALAEAHDALVAASEAKQWAEVIRIATVNKTLLTCADMDSLWRTAEAFAQAGNEARAVEGYGYVLTNCPSPAERLATVQKAGVALQSTEAFDQLLAMGARQPDGSGEFDGLRLDRFRRRIGEAAAGTATAQPTQADIDAVTANAKTPAGQPDAELLGWYNYKRKKFPEAQQWFRTALNTGPSQKAAEGLVMALRAGGDKDGARQLAVKYADLDPLNRKLMVDVLSTTLTDPTAKPLTKTELAVFAQAVEEFKSEDGVQALRWYAANKNDNAMAVKWARKSAEWKGEEIEAQKSAEGAEALGWLLFQANDVAGAEGWFKKSAEWTPSESAAVGLVVTARRLNHTRDYTDRIAQYRATYPRIAELEVAMRPRANAPRAHQAHVAAHRPTAGTAGQWDRSADEIIKVYKAGQYETAVTMLDQRRSKQAEPRGLAVIRGWALYQKGDWEGAKTVFSHLDGNGTSHEKEVGLRVIEMSYTNPRFR